MHRSVPMLLSMLRTQLLTQSLTQLFTQLLTLLLTSLLTLSLTPLPSAAAPLATITFAEQPVRLWRDTSFYSVARGAALQANDLIDANGATILLDAGGSTIALGPDAQVYLKSATELVLLQGWLKLRGAATQGARLSTAQLQFDGTATTVTLHAAPGVSELFAEAGSVPVTEMAAGKAQRNTLVPREQFATKDGAQPLQLAPHPPPGFIKGMPRTFLDALVPLSVKGPAPPPRRERAATFAELAPLLAEQPALRQQVQRRFQPVRAAPARLSNALF